MIIRALCLLFLANGVSAGQIWVVGGDAYSLVAGHAVRWEAGVIFHNFTDRDGIVRVLHVSNGGRPPLPADTVPANTSTSSFNAGTVSPEWVTEYDISPEITPEPRLELFPMAVYGPGPEPFPLPPVAKVTMPVVSRLSAPGELQRHLGTDQGASEVRLNVGVYNAGTERATANVTVTRRVIALPTPVPDRRSGVAFTSGCSPSVTYTFSIPPDTFTQMPIDKAGLCFGSLSLETFTTVVVDQPSLSVVSALADSPDSLILTSVSPTN